MSDYLLMDMDFSQQRQEFAMTQADIKGGGAESAGRDGGCAVKRGGGSPHAALRIDAAAGAKS